jgi:hypothetical protein
VAACALFQAKSAASNSQAATLNRVI